MFRPVCCRYRVGEGSWKFIDSPVFCTLRKLPTSPGMKNPWKRMKPIEIVKDLFFFERGYLNANHFVYRSAKPILIDTGYLSDFDQTADLINQLGVHLPDVSLIIGTHCHCDHVGGHKKIQDLSGCDIALHKIGKYFIDTQNDWATWWQYFSQEAAFFDCTLTLNDGDVVAVGPHEFTIIHTPGHAADGMVLYNRHNKLLISADTLWRHDMALLNLRIEGSAAPFQMLESLERLEALDVSMVYPGHGPPFSDMKKAVVKTRNRLTHFLNHREQMGLDLIKKMIVYILMMKKNIIVDSFFDDLIQTYWYKETIDLYFNGDYGSIYDTVMKDFKKRGIVIIRGGYLMTTIKP